MTNELRNATITQDELSIEAIVYPSGEIFALVNDEDADRLPFNVQTIDDCIECGMRIGDVVA